MPNWVTNEITSPSLDKIVKLMGEEFDFNKIKPMPESLNIDDSNELLLGVALITGELPTWVEHHDDLIFNIIKS